MEFKSLYLPDIVRWDVESLTGTFGRLEITPLERGFGRTLGNSLRRVLLSSLEGCAPVTLSIKDVRHEFSIIPGVVEDVPEIVLNVKSLVLRQKGDQQGTLRLNASKEGVYTAADLECDPFIEVINPQQQIATVGKGGKLIMEIAVRSGKGFMTVDEIELAEQNNTEGTILLDAWFCPVTRVNYSVQSARVGDRTDYDHLILDITTNGSISPRDAVNAACEILIKHFQLIPGGVEPAVVVPEPPAAEPKPAPRVKEDPVLPLEDSGIPIRIVNILKAGGVKTLSGLRAMTAGELLDISGFGPSSLKAVNEALEERGLPSIG
jgi:DNA-directed RNA polymerase subunit alpha